MAGFEASCGFPTGFEVGFEFNGDCGGYGFDSLFF